MFLTLLFIITDNNRPTFFMIVPVSPNPCYAEPSQFSFDQGMR